MHETSTRSTKVLLGVEAGGVVSREWSMNWNYKKGIILSSPLNRFNSTVGGLTLWHNRHAIYPNYNAQPEPTTYRSSSTARLLPIKTKTSTKYIELNPPFISNKNKEII